MNLDDFKLGDLKKIAGLFNGQSSTTLNEECVCTGVKIVILQRGWVVVGRFSQTGQQCKITNGYVVRKWGTSEGLPELAIKGPLANTVLDKSPDISFHVLTIVAAIDCEEGKWKKHCPVA